MKKTLLSILFVVIFGCQADKSPKTEIIISNLGQEAIENLWISLNSSKLNIGTLKAGEHKNIFLDAIGNKRIDYGFQNDDALRGKMGGELFFYGNQIPMKSGILEVGFKNGLIHRLMSKQKE